MVQMIIDKGKRTRGHLSAPGVAMKGPKQCNFTEVFEHYFTNSLPMYVMYITIQIQV